MEKIITTSAVYKHPYKWDVEITWGTKEEMLLANGYEKFEDNIEIGGSFNKAMWDAGGRQAPLVIIALYKKGDTEDTYVGVKRLPWEGCRCFLKGEMGIDENIKNGIYPVKIDWDGKTYIERWREKGKTSECYYELVDCWRY